MAKKNSKAKQKLKFNYDAPISISFALITVILFLADLFVFKFKLNHTVLLTPTVAAGNMPFSFKNPLSYLQLFLYVFGGTDKIVLFFNLIVIMLLGPQMEERYGSVIIGIMIFVSSLFTGVLNASCCQTSVSGAGAIVFMLIILNILMHLTKKTVSISSVCVIALFVCCQFFCKNPNGVVGVLIILAGGLCGSLFAFLASPKARTSKKKSKSEDSVESPETPEVSQKKSVFRKKNNKKSPGTTDSDETIVGTLP